MPRFVLLHHELPVGNERPSHWDLMLERDGVLRTWALQQIPEPGVEIIGLELADHRLAYLDYEGPISGDRGHVTRTDAGEYALVHELPDEVLVLLKGQRLRGRLLLQRAAKSDDDLLPAQSWVARLLPVSEA